jgi:uncharacterized protein with NRDE domain
MCTLLILRHLQPQWPLILAANRDELYERPASGPQVLPGTPRIIVPGLDSVRGGAWMGVTTTGFFVGLTNQRGSLAQGVAPRSRGEVVLEALRSGSLEAAERYLETVDPAAYNPFNLLYGDASRLRVAYARPASGRLERQDVPEGLHVLPNDVLDSPALPKVERARRLVVEHAQRPWPELASRLQEVLADHHLPLDGPRPELQALCIHTPAYGTRSSALLALAPGRVAHFLASDVPPCQHAFRDAEGLLTPL